MRKALLFALLLGLGANPAEAQGLVSPVLHVAAGGSAGPQVALTFDLCSGEVDMRILGMLIAEAIPATLFVTARWLRRNPAALALLLAHPELFELEDHGAEHVPAVLGRKKVYGLAPAGTLAAIDAEIGGGDAAIFAASGHHTGWYRGAAALYSPAAVEEIARLGYHLAGFSLNGDDGATKSAAAAETTVAGAVDGDVIIAHLNQPRRKAGAGIAAGVLALKARGFRFVQLARVATIGG